MVVARYATALYKGNLHEAVAELEKRHVLAAAARQQRRWEEVSDGRF